ncbi:hypothetical protein WICPIJ_007205 [Wickerhamomyces pijperi]|uniref:Tricalbin-1 n=1 Tax=Wickerhamomyces pijperi TaxID=599730 RepID=A0A9P8Q272_WICPI|nr:hypothetical protein WICPIJ_007205 [Wickerhamomyces pijperi]
MSKQPLHPNDPTTELVSGQDDVIKKATDLPYNASESKGIDEAKIKEAEELARASVREPVPATSVGWKQIGEWEEKDALTAEDELTDLSTPTMLESYIPDWLYGEWYHSVGAIIGAALLSFIVGYFRFSIAPVFFITLAASVYYRSTIKKHRFNVRYEVHREFRVKRIEDDRETMDWLNTFLDKYWIYLEPSISQIVTEQVNPIFAEQEAIPAFVKSIWIDQFTAGTKPPRIDFVKTLDIPKDDVVVMDWGFSFTPHSTADATCKQLKNYVNQRVVIKAKLFGVTIPIVVEDVHVKAWARIRLKMITSFPHIEVVNVTLMEPPQFDFMSKILGESVFNWEVLSVPGLFNFINEMVKTFVGHLLFTPFSFELNVPQLLAGSKTAVGVLCVKVKAAKDLKAADRVRGNTVDPYLTFKYHAQPDLAKTKTILDTCDPHWDEVVYLLVQTFGEPLIIKAWDYNDDRKDTVLGSLQIDMNEITSKGVSKNNVETFMRNSKPVGQLLFDYEFFPTLEETKLRDGSTQPPPSLNTGLTKIEFSEIRGLKNPEEPEKPVTSTTELYFNDQLVKKSAVAKNNDHPKISIPLETIILDRRKAKVKILVKDARSKIIAASIQPLNTLIDRTEVNNEWIPFSKGEGEFKISALWKSIALREGSGVGGYTEPIGVVRVLINKAESLKDNKKFGTLRPYIRALVNGTPEARTDFVPETIDPVFDEALYIPVTSPNQRLTIEAMDAQKNGIDHTLGSFDVKTSKIIEEDEQGNYLTHIDSKLRTGRLVQKKGTKGIVTYALSFYPVLPVKTLEDIEEDLEREAKIKRAKEEAEAAVNDDSKTSKDAKKKKIAEEEEDFVDNKKKLLTLNELIQHPTGLFVYTVLSGEFHSIHTYLQFFFDDHGYADYTSAEIKHKSVNVPNTGDCLVKELEWSTVTIRLVKDPHANRNSDAIAESTIPVLNLLKNSYHEPNQLTLTGLGNNRVRIQTQWIPLDIARLPQSDLITNSGILDLDIISGTDLLSADSNGKSDPYVKVYLNKAEDFSFKTQKVKKTLDPVWDEKTSVEIRNRVNSTLKFVVMDWDFGNANDPLGEAVLDLAEIDPLNAQEHKLPIVGPKGENGGFLTIRTSFRPRYIVTVNSITTNIGDAGLNAIGTGVGAGLDVGGKVIGGGLDVGGKVVGGVLGGGVKGVKGLFGAGGKRTSASSSAAH